MEKMNEYIDSGILEMYVLGLTSNEENIEIVKLAELHPAIENEIKRITENLVQYGESKVGEVDVTLQPLILAAIEYSERIENGEKVTLAPILTSETTIKDFEQWIERKDMVLGDDFVDFQAKFISQNEEAVTAIIWLKYGAPHETHNKLIEKFLVLEGTCDIVTDDGNSHSLKSGDYFSIPLHVGHYVKVTSEIPCKIILQRIAA